MPPAAVHALLSRIANDDDFRDWLGRDAASALAAYDLSDDEARLFTQGGAAASALLAYEARGEARPTSQDAPDVPGTAPLLTGSPLPLATLLLQVVPSPQVGPDGQNYIAHVAALHPPGADHKTLGGAWFSLDLAPLAVPRPDGSVQVHYAATIDPLGEEAEEVVEGSDWGHDTESVAVREAAQAVHDAEPGERHAAILALIEQVTRSGL
jgi:hypothetical protein